MNPKASTVEDMLARLDLLARKLEASRGDMRSLVKNNDQKELLDQVLTTIAAQMLESTLKGIDLNSQGLVAKLLLQRNEDRRQDERLKLLKTELRKDKGRKLSVKEKQLRLRGIFGIS